MGFEFSGFEELLGELNRIGRDVKAAEDEALISGGDVIRETAAQNAPRSASGNQHKWGQRGAHLADNIIVSAPKTDENGERYVLIGPKTGGRNKDDFFYGYIIENGFIHLGGKSRRKRNPRPGKPVPPHPFLEPAYLTERNNALRAMAEVLRRVIHG